MSEDIQTLQRFAYKSFSGILSDGYQLLIKNWLNIFGPMAIFLVISIILKNLLLSDLYWNVNLLSIQFDNIFNKFTLDPNSLTEADYQIIMDYIFLTISTLTLESMIGCFFTIIAMSSVSNYLLKRYREIDTNFFNEFKSSLNFKLIITALLLGIGIPLGLILFIAPALVLFGYYIFSIIIYHNNGEHPLKEARLIAKGYFWKIIGVFLVSALITGVLTLIFQLILDFTIPVNISTYFSWYNPNNRNYGMIILYDFLHNHLINILLGPLFICFLTVLYTSIKSKKIMRNKFGKESEITPYSFPQFREPSIEKSRLKLTNKSIGNKINNGIYCPFCGRFMEKKLDKCPHCNQPLDFEI